MCSKRNYIRLIKTNNVISNNNNNNNNNQNYLNITPNFNQL